MIAQNSVQGMVTERGGDVLPGAQVLVIGTNLGSVTDSDGRYQITGVPVGPATLTAVYLGYRDGTQSTTLAAGENEVNFQLFTSPIELDAIVVTGTAGETQNRAIGNAVSKIDASEVLDKAPVTNLAELIQGRSAGTVVFPSSGTVGTGASIRIRGLSSITQSNEPLLYVDGVRIDNDPKTGVEQDYFYTGGQAPSRLNDINLEDIESIEIIKGPAAATLYGTEAAAGVIQILTKKGRAGETRWNIRSSWGTVDLGNNDFPDNFGVVDPNDLPLGVASLDELEGVRLVETLENGSLLIAQNPIEQLIETGTYQEYDLSASGGGDVFTFYVSGSFMSEGGVMPANFAEKIGGRANFQWTPSEVFDLAVSSGYVNNEARLPTNDDAILGLWTNALLGTPSAIARNSGGNFLFGEPFTPLEDARKIDTRFTNDRFTGSVTANFSPFPWMRNRAIFGMDLNAEENTQFYPFGAVTNLFPEGQKSNLRVTALNITFDYNGTGTFDLTPALQSSTSVGMQATNENVDTVIAVGKGFPVAGVSTVSAAANREAFETRVEDVTVGVYLQEQVAWQDRLFLTGAVRFDDNSAFGSNFDFETYPKVSASYVVSEEPFFSVPFVETLKLRGAYGFAGKQPAAFAAQRLFSPVSIRGGTPTITPNQLGNPDLGPERSRELEVGLDAGLWQDRIGVELTYYNKVTEDALVARIIPPSTGFPTSQLANIGEVENTGWELGIDGLLVDTRFVDYSFLLNLATNDNEVTNLGGEPGFPVGFGHNRVEEGFPLDGIWGRVIVGREENGDLILSDEKEFLGRSTPDFTASWGNTFTLWDNLQVYALFDWARGFVVDNNNTPFRLDFGSAREVNDPDFIDPAELNDLLTFVSTAEPTPFVEDGDFVKLREVSATYTLPERWAAALRARRASVTVSGRNLATWTDYSGVDPEVNGFGQEDIPRWDFGTVPQSRRFITTLSLTF